MDTVTTDALTTEAIEACDRLDQLRAETQTVLDDRDDRIAGMVLSGMTLPEITRALGGRLSLSGVRFAALRGERRRRRA